jgi:hypothetical protein
MFLFARKGPLADGGAGRERRENQINDSVRIGFDEDVKIGLKIQKGGARKSSDRPL